MMNPALGLPGLLLMAAGPLRTCAAWSPGRAAAGAATIADPYSRRLRKKRI